MKSVGLYSGSFDPFTQGHASVLHQALMMFDEVYIVLGVNPAKKPYMPIQVRCSIIERWAKRNGFEQQVKVNAVANEYLADTAERIGATIIRGIRNAQDYEYEQTVFDVNKTIAPAVPTVYFFTDQKYRNISSSLVRGMIGFQNWEDRVANFVPEETLTAIKAQVYFESQFTE